MATIILGNVRTLTQGGGRDADVQGTYQRDDQIAKFIPRVSKVNYELNHQHQVPPEVREWK